MAAPMRVRLSFGPLRKVFSDLSSKTVHQSLGRPTPKREFQSQSSDSFFRGSWARRTWQTLAVGATAVVGVVAMNAAATKPWRVHAASALTPKPDIPPSRSMRFETDSTGLKLTLFQFQTCPFCCKVRAMLDYYGISYDVVEVNSVFKTQIKWSKYRKVPILVADGMGDNGYLQIIDSCVIISLIESWLKDREIPLEKLYGYFPCLESKEGRKTIYEFPNKYFIMYQDQDVLHRAEQLKEERKWRRWADDTMVHMLSPNVYRTPREALQAFRYFSDVGEWEKNFAAWERLMVIYVGAAAMYLLSKVLKKRYSLKDDVRVSLYDACDEWVKAVGNKRPFLGGEQPNLGDLAVYGVLSSIEGCEAFQDMLENTKIGPWFRRTKAAVSNHAGAQYLM